MGISIMTSARKSPHNKILLLAAAGHRCGRRYKKKVDTHLKTSILPMMLPKYF